MINFIEYVLQQVKNQGISQADALELLAHYAGSAPAGHLHPLLHRNVSSLEGLRFISTLDNGNVLTADHHVSGVPVLPGVAYLEMAHAAFVASSRIADTVSSTAIRIKHVVWLQPLAASTARDVYLALYPQDQGEMAFEVYTLLEADGGRPTVHAQGQIRREAMELAAPALDLGDLRERCSATVESNACYAAFESLGLSYGASYRSLGQLYLGEDGDGRRFVLASLQWSTCVGADAERYTLHPSILDGALQASIGLAFAQVEQNGAKPSPALPFALDSLQMFDRSSLAAWALVRAAAGPAVAGVQKVDIDLCDDTGRVCVRLQGLAARRVEHMTAAATDSEARLLRPQWEPKAAQGDAWGSRSEHGQHLVLLDAAFEGSLATLSARYPLRQYALLPARHDGEQHVSEWFFAASEQLRRRLQALLAEKPAQRILMQMLLAVQPDKTAAALSGLLKSATRESTKFTGQLIELPAAASTDELVQAVEENARDSALIDPQVRYVHGTRQVLSFKPLNMTTHSEEPLWRDRGVYLITGGAGALGLIFAEDIARRSVEPRIVLTGRSALSEAKYARLSALQALGAQVEYRVLDVADEAAVRQFVAAVVAECGALHGVLHSAGVINDALLVSKDAAEFRAVLAPKVLGTVNLDRATQTLDLDVFLLFSSLAGVAGNAGQADYATANAFMDCYAVYRNTLVVCGQRRGRSLSINWPLWQDGGMSVDAATRERLHRQGVGMLAQRQGVDALHMAWRSGEAQVVVTAELASAGILTLRDDARDIRGGEVGVAADALAQRIERILVGEIARQLKVKEADIDADAEFSEFGFDSISLTAFGNKLKDAFGLDINPALFFEYSTIRAFAGYLYTEHGSQVSASLHTPMPATPEPSRQQPSPFARNTQFVRVAQNKPDGSVRGDAHEHEPVAIIGMSGCFPGAPDLDVFWENLHAGKDCIEQIPLSRWDWREIYGNPRSEANKTNIKWGGFIEGVDEFDALFFGISPKEARLMDPQQRLLLTYGWKAIEDAGYAAQSLSGTRTGVFVGTGSSGYSHLALKAGVQIEGFSATGATPSLGPNRLSYLLNLHGPSEPIETACSSSLVAIHRALRAIQAGDCEMVLAGGVNSIILPWGHISFSRAGMLSEDGRCKPFARDAAGYVRGEGVGMLLLKKLSAAERDGDAIHALILGSAQNHGGRANSLTAPNPKAQAELIRAAYADARIDPAVVTYIETHGTGTPLGDPIEIKGLCNAFADVRTDGCAVGSVKSNIGHLELAAGIAGVIKVVLQLKQRMLAKSLYCEEDNPLIPWEGSPFWLVKQTQPWPALEDAYGRQLPRTAGVSSFGFGGVNAHVVVQEYSAPNETPTARLPQHPALIVLSAKNDEQLRERARLLLGDLTGKAWEALDLWHIAYTLQNGREPMDERLAFVVQNIAQLQAKLARYLADDAGSIHDGGSVLYRGNARRGRDVLVTFMRDEAMSEWLQRWFEKGDYEKLLETWCQGLALDWNRFYGDVAAYAGYVPRRVHLSTYPFARIRCWVEQADHERTSDILLPEGDKLPVASSSSSGEQRAALNRQQIEQELLTSLAQALNIDATSIDHELAFSELGLDSITGVAWVQALNERFGTSMAAARLYDYPNIQSLAQHLSGQATYEAGEIERQQQSLAATGMSLMEEQSLQGPVLLMPHWEATVPEFIDSWPAMENRVLLIGGTPAQQQPWLSRYPNLQVLRPGSSVSVEELGQVIAASDRFDHIVWLAPASEGDGDAWIDAQSTGVIALYRLIQALLSLGYGSSVLGWSIVTWRTQRIERGERIEPAHASVHGFVGSLAKEYRNWSIRLVDMPDDETSTEWESRVVDVLRLPADSDGDTWAYRSGEWHRQKLLLYRSGDAHAPVYRQGGVYVVIGGAGGIGVVFSEYLIRHYQAQMIWIGRRVLDASIKARIDRLAEWGPAPMYLTADAADNDALAHAYRQIKAHHGTIHGVVHAAIVLADKSLAQMDEARFIATLSAKINVCVRMEQVFITEQLDFVLFFSSIQSRSKLAGQSNYAAACTFKDAFAQRLAQAWPCVVKIINWGYWGEVGIVASDSYRTRMAQQGVGSITPAEGMAALETLLASPAEQLMLLKLAKPIAPSTLSESNECIVPVVQQVAVSPSDDTPLVSSRPMPRPSAEELSAVDSLRRQTCELLYVQLHSLGLLSDLQARSGLSAVQRRWLEESLSLLDQNACLSTALDEQVVWRQWGRSHAEWMATPQLRAQANVLDIVLRALPQILSGESLATEVLFPNASMTLLEGLYKDNAIADYFNAVLADVVEAFVRDRLAADPGAQIRILEIGAGTGGFSKGMFERLQPYETAVIDYCYTDLSQAFLTHARRNYTAVAPYASYRLLDIEQSLDKQGIESGSYDVVVAANVLHATGDVRSALRHAKTALKQGGLLLLGELSTRDLFTHLTFGLLDGWWQHRDKAIRMSGTPALAPCTWARILDQEGFHAVHFPVVAAHALGQQVIVARSDGLIRQPLCVVGKASPGDVAVLPALQHNDIADLHDDTAIAIIGMSGAFPGASNLADFWRNIAEGNDCISEMPAWRWSIDDYYDPDSRAEGKTYSKWMGVLESAAEFDPLFFNITPAEAECMDPQQRLFLQHAWSAIEDAGIDPQGLSGSDCAVYVGCTVGDYGLVSQDALSAKGLMGASAAILAGRVSYHLNLKGTCVAVDTACSSSLVAIAQACDNLLLGRSELALAGGVCVLAGPAFHVMASKAGMLSASGRCYTFDARADGFVPAEGVGVVMLKRLSDAVRDRNPIHGVIRGWGINQDGRTNGITAPSMQSQMTLEKRVYDSFGIDPSTITLFEAHGTGTKLGDPIEVEALNNAFGAYTDKRGFCALGSVKSMIGHPLAAAGVAGVLKVLLALRHRALPPITQFTSLNEHISLEQGAFYLNRQLRAWNSSGAGLRRAAVSSFGFSGTNAHVVIDEYPFDNASRAVPASGERAIVLSARDADGLREQALQLRDYVSGVPCGNVELADIAYTLQLGRQAMEHRLAFVASNRDDIVRVLNEFITGIPSSELFVGRAKRSDSEAALSRGEDLCVLAQGWVRGAAIDWQALYDGVDVRATRLPTYPFKRERYWIGAAPRQPKASVKTTSCELQLWERQLQAQAVETPTDCWYDERWVLLTQEFAQHAPALGDGNTTCRVLGAFGSVAERVECYGEQVFLCIKTLLQSRRRGKRLLQIVTAADGADPNMAMALSALLRSASLENPSLVGQVVEMNSAVAASELQGMLRENLGAPGSVEPEVKYIGQRRHVMRFVPLAPTHHDDRVTLAQDIPWKDGGVYLLSGGAGGLGMMLAREILGHCSGVKLVLLGRSEVDRPKRARIEALKCAGTDVTVEYLRVDIADCNEVESCVKGIVQRYGKLDGVIHAAGITRDSFLIKKTLDEFRSVLRPKIPGVTYLDRVTADLDLDFFIVMSGLAGVFGNIGQADYAFANAYVDRFAVWRDALQRQGLRKGRSLSMAWPLWKEGGMQMDAATQAHMQRLGLHPMETALGWQALYRAWAGMHANVVVLYAESQALAAIPAPISPGHAFERRAGERALRVDEQDLKIRTLEKLKGVFSEVTKLQLKSIDAEETFEHYGIDSITIVQLNDRLAEVFDALPKTLFFEYATLGQICGYLVAECGEACLRWTGLAVAAEVEAQQGEAIIVAPAPESYVAPQLPALVDHSQPECIAIIGLSGRYPDAPNVAAFWKNLAAGRSSISEWPAERWSIDDHFEADVDKAVAEGKSYSKWGGFIDGFADFDPLFFGISPREAVSMDPQERLFLQASWEVLEDAGYTRESLGARHQRRVGVFVGITRSGFTLYGPELVRIGDKTPLYTSFASVANRVSYLFDLNGPSMPVDTMCSASLSAVHEACEHIKRGECELAIAGGVNLYLHPSSYAGLSMQRMLARGSECRSFGADGDGFVPGEGVGAVLLKPLQRAIDDGDHIYGVIRATSVNHGGKTNGYTVPNPAAQAELITQALQRAGISAREVSYIEAHGTGTALGDPVEIDGLTRAFSHHTGDKQYCAIGSVKSNIGHLESAAGIAGLTKVLLQMKHGKLVPSLHAQHLNPYIDFARTPFRVQQTLDDWQRPLLGADGVQQEHPRMAGISSFGAGGANAHVIVQEYSEHRAPLSWRPSVERPALVVLSARSQAQLRDAATRLQEQLQKGVLQESELADLAYTLQLGREAMDHRLGLTVTSLAQLSQKLSDYLSGRDDVEGCYHSEARKNEDWLADFSSDEDAVALCEGWLEKGKYARVLEFWSKGLAVDWKRLYGPGIGYDAQKPHRISLPTYSFAKERYWLPSAALTRAAPSIVTDKNGQDVPDECLLFSQDWITSPILQASSQVPVKTILVVLPDVDLQQRVAVTLRELSPATRVVFIAQSSERALQSLVDSVGVIDAVWYLCGINREEAWSGHNNFADFVQCCVKAGTGAVKLLVAGEYRSALERCQAEAWIGYEHSLRRAWPGIEVAIIQRDLSLGVNEDASLASRQIEELVLWLWQEQHAAKLESARYAGGERQVLRIRPLAEWDTVTPNGLRQGGTYLITGGAGGLGQLFAQHLASRYAAKLVLVGRKSTNAHIEEQLATLRAAGGEACYIAADVADASQMQTAIEQAIVQFGPLHGVIHAAGMAEGGGSITVKPLDAFSAVLRPKIEGTSVLDAVLRPHVLDFVCYFSSSSAVLGDFGACDYAVGNRFQLAHASYANDRAFTICWPLWRHGGMSLGNADAAHLYLRSSGQRLLEDQEGLAIFERMLAQHLAHRRRHVLVLAGEASRIHRMLGLVPAAAMSDGKPTPRQLEEPDESTFRHVLRELQDVAGALLQIDPQKMDATENLANFGFDSVGLMEFAKRLSAHFALDISPSVFFNHVTLGKLALHLANERGAHIMARRAPASLVAAGTPAIDVAASDVSSVNAPSVQVTLEHGEAKGDERIAVVGMSGRFPKARTVHALWQLLAEGRDGVQEIPLERFDWRDSYQAQQSTGESWTPTPGKSYGKWLGLLPGVDEFDPLFFEISPKEAEWMDPRQRLLLQEIFNAFEDAGFVEAQWRNGRVGTFVGVEQGEYQWLVSGAGEPGSLTGNHDAILASRLAYFMDFHGPTMAINTACSSGLVALHQACLSLRAGECDVAVAAGANVILTPQTFIAMSQAGMLSADGTCRAFDERADGLVPGEAVVAIVLKRLANAEADGDLIYGVIAGSGVNYDGKTQGITAPSGAAQAELIADVYRRAQISPCNIDYVIAHGTGTRLGDPVEIEALDKVFSHAGALQAACAIGSVKANLGHTFAASGLVSLVSLLQAMQHELIPPSVHCERLNAYVAWDRSALQVNRTAKPWPRRPGKQRLGAVSAFGMSGTNAHVVVESYDRRPADTTADAAAPAFLLVLSAKTEAALKERASDLLAWCHARPAITLSSLSYTLLCHRQHFAVRCAVVVRNWAEALAALEAMAEGRTMTGMIREQVARGFTERPVLRRYAVDMIDKLASQRNDQEAYAQALGSLAELFCLGYAIAGRTLWEEHGPLRLSLPGYPFAKEQYWLPRKTVLPAAVSTVPSLLQRNTSTLSAQRFSSTFDGSEFFLRDHVVNGHHVLPGVAYLEMARAALERSLDDKCSTLELRDVMWLRPLTVTQAREVHVQVEGEVSGELMFVIYTLAAGATGGTERVVHAEGRAVPLDTVAHTPSLDLAPLRERCATSIDITAGYDALSRLGLVYGSTFRGLQRLDIGQGGDGARFVLARVELPAELRASASDFYLHPSLLDSALQSSMGLTLYGAQLQDNQSAPLRAALPFALQRLDIFAPSPAQAWAYVRPSTMEVGSGLQKLDIDICDDAGRVCVRLIGFVSRPQEGSSATAAVRPTVASSSAEDTWHVRAVEYLVRVLASTLKVPMQRVEANAEFGEYGVDSITALQLLGELQRVFGALPKTLMFEYQTVDALAGYFVAHHREALMAHLSEAEAGQNEAAVPQRVAQALSGIDTAVAVEGVQERVLMLSPSWQVAATADVGGPNAIRRCVMLDGTFGRWMEILRARHPAVHWSVLDVGDTLSLEESMSRLALQVFTRVREMLGEQPREPALLQLVLNHDSAMGDLSAALSGLLRSAVQENPQWLGQVIELSGIADAAALAQVVHENAHGASARESLIRYRYDVREVARLKELRSNAGTGEMPWKDGGVYLIVGGAGGLGMILAKEIATQVRDARIVLAGRAALSSAQCERQDALRARYPDLLLTYRELDVCDETAVTDCVTAIVEQYGCLDGVIQAAGVIRDNFFLKKNEQELLEVLSPKVKGTVNLDRATRHLDLDFMLLCSSLAGAMGNIGQSDYAFANAFMDRYAGHRNLRLKEEGRRGHTLSINWPLWAEGGMRVDEITLMLMRQEGLDTLSTQEGLAALYQAWSSGETQVLVFAGVAQTLRGLLGDALLPQEAGERDERILQNLLWQAPRSDQHYEQVTF